MAYSTRTIGIIVASVIAVACIGSAVLISGPLPFHFFSRVNAESTHDLLVSYAAKDTDGDGLPDWEEALYGTDPSNPHSVSASMTDGEAVAHGLIKPRFQTATSTPADSAPGGTPAPETVTDQFARTLFAQYLSQRGNTTPTPQDIQNFVSAAVTDLTNSQHDPDTYSIKDVHIGPTTGTNALISYAAALENVFSKNTAAADSDALTYLSDAMNGDASGYRKLVALSKAYGGVATDMMGLSVPSEAVSVHVAIANAMKRMSVATADMAVADTDPIRGLLGIGSYDNRAMAMLKAFSSLNDLFKSEGAVFVEGQPGYFIYSTSAAAAGTELSK